MGSGTSPCPNPIAVSASITGDTCGQNTGAISVTTTGGSGQIFYQWSPGGGAVEAQSMDYLQESYSVQITDITGCDTTVTYVVSSVNPSFSLSTSSTDESCGCDGSASVTVNGNGPFYQWDDLNGQTTSTAADLCAGSYMVVVSDGSGCSSSATVTVGSAPSAVSVNVTSTDQTDATSPDDGSASAFASGGTPPYSYLWSNGGTDAIINGLAAGSYSVDVTDANGCSGSASVTVTANIDTTTSILSMNWQGDITISESKQW